MIQVYDVNNKNFNMNGDMAIQPISAILTNAINSIPSIELELNYDEYRTYDYLHEQCVIKCATPWSLDLFRIYETEKDIDSIKVYGRHIFADLMNTIAKDYNNNDIGIVATGSCLAQTALDKLLANTNFNGHSNISKLDSVRWERKTITQALLSDDDNSFIKRWGGELFVNNFDIYMNDRIGEDNGVRISYGKNLDSIEQNIKTDELVTRIIPVGANGLHLVGKTPWVDSPNINLYPKIYEKVVEFSNVKIKENSTDTDGFATEDLARQELIRLSNLMFSQQHVDTPSINIKTNMVDIRDSIEYRQLGYSGLEVINLGDIVTCTHSKLGIDTKTRVISYKWDILTEKMQEIEIGDVQLNYFDKQTDLSNKVSNVINSNGNLKAESIQGVIDATKSKFKALKDVAQKQHVRAMLFEDLDPNSSTFGAMCIGTMGFEIASQRNSDNIDWDWRTFGSGKGFVADCITTGILKAITIESNDGSLSMDLKNGIMKLNGSTIWTGHNGSYAMVDGEGIQFYDGITKRKTFNLFYSTKVTLPAYNGSGNSATSTSVQLPSQFKNKSIQVFTSISKMESNGVPGTLGVVSSCDVSASVSDYANAIVDVSGMLDIYSLTDKINYSRNQDMVITLTAIA